jgi:hypothetical protein
MLTIGACQQGRTRSRWHRLRGDRGVRVGELAGRHRDGNTKAADGKSYRIRRPDEFGGPIERSKMLGHEPEELPGRTYPDFIWVCRELRGPARKRTSATSFTSDPVANGRSDMLYATKGHG